MAVWLQVMACLSRLLRSRKALARWWNYAGGPVGLLVAQSGLIAVLFKLLH